MFPPVSDSSSDRYMTTFGVHLYIALLPNNGTPVQAWSGGAWQDGSKSFFSVLQTGYKQVEEDIRSVWQETTQMNL